MAISSPGIGSNLDVNGIITKLMQVEAQPLTTLATKEAGYQAKLTAFGTLNGALSSFQTAVASLNSPAKFQALTASSADSSILTASVSSQAIAGNYSIAVSQLAQAQTITTSGQTSVSAAIGAGTSTTLSFQFGAITGGSFIKTGTALSASAAASGITANALSINGTNIVTSGTTNSAKNLATQINLSTGTTGVTATAAATDTGVLAFTPVTTGVADAYTLVVGTTTLASIGASSGLTAAQLDTAISTGAGAAGLASDGITFTGTAVGGNLHFTKADGANVNITQTLTNTSTTATGGISGLTSGTAKAYTSSVSLASANAISVAGLNPALAGLSAGNGVYTGATYTQDSNQASGSVIIDNTNNSLQGIRDAINKASIGVTASIVADGSATPNHLVLTSNKTGATSSMKIGVTGDATISTLLAYDPAGTQNLTQSTAAQNTMLTVNGISVSSTTGSVSEAIQGTSLNVLKVGTTNLSIARDTTSATNAITQFVKAYNDIDSALKSATAYDPATKVAGPLFGNAAARAIQADIRKTLSTPIEGLSGSITNLAQVGVAFQKNGSLALDSSKLQSAIATNFNDIGSLFASIGTTTDSLVSFVSSTNTTKVGSHALNITALATQGSSTGSAPAGLTINAGVNDGLNLVIDGVSASVILAAGTYTITSLIAQVQSAINGASALSGAGIAVNVTANGGNVLNITSNRYGSSSSVGVSGIGAANLLGGTPTSTAGVDVAGTVDGILANGSGQTLNGATGSASEGLKLTITGGGTGDRGKVTVSRGYGFQLNALADTFLGTKGLVPSQTDGIKSSIKNISTQRDAFNVKLAAIEKRYRAQFTALDVTISSMTQTQSFLTQQLASIANLSKQN